MTLDAIRPLGLEDPASGGSQTYNLPTELDPRSDAVDAAGLFCNAGVTTPDKSVLLSRLSGSMQFTDQLTSRILSEFVCTPTGQVGSHNALTELEHMALGPSDGWASGAQMVTTWSGLLVASRTWYTSTAQTTKIYSEAYSYTGVLLSTITRVVYSAGTAIRTYTDTFAYSGLMPTGTTRTWS